MVIEIDAIMMQEVDDTSDDFFWHVREHGRVDLIGNLPSSMRLLRKFESRLAMS